MSLINEALKKAQRQRSLDSAPLSSAPSGVAAAAVTTHVRAASHRRSLAPLWFGLGLVALGVVATVLVMRYGLSPETPAKPVAVVAPAPAAPGIGAASSSPPASPSAPAPAQAAPEAAAPLVMLPPIARTAPASAQVPLATPVASVPVPAPVAATPLAASTEPAPVAATPVAAVLTPAEQEAQAYSFLNTIRLTGVRGLDREARVLMNERVWRLNDVVSPELGLRLSAVRPNLLVFTDSQGRTYEKPY